MSEPRTKDQAEKLREIVKDAYDKIVDRYRAFDSTKESRAEFIKRVAEELKVAPILINSVLIEVTVNDALRKTRT